MKDPNGQKMKEEKIRDVLANPRRRRVLSDAKRREFIARFYKVGEERKSVKHFVLPVKTYILPVASAAVLALAVMTFTFLFAPVYPAVTNVEGTVKIYRASSNEWVFAEGRKMRLGRNDILKTFPGGQADLIIPGLYHIRLKDDSEMRLARSISRAVSGRLDYALEKGRMLACYDKRRRIGKELAITTPQAVASAVGTEFMVASTPTLGQTTVGVLDGVVKVNSLGMPGAAGRLNNEVLVKAGERTVIRKGGVPARPTHLPEDELLNMEELYSIGSRPQVALLISTGTTRTRELLSVTPLYISSEAAGSLPVKLEKMVKDFNRAIRGGAKEEKLESIEEFEEIVNKRPNPRYNVHFLLFIGSYYEYIGEYKRAISTFERVLRDYPRSSLASIARCAIGIIYEEKLKDLDRAKAAYQKVLSDYPASPEAEEASAGLARLTK